MRQDIIFGEKSARYDFGMFCSSMVITPPVPRRNIVEVPGMNGALDLSSAITPYITYGERTITLTFYMIDYQRNWPDRYPEILAAIHGQRHHVVMKDDPEWYWDAYCQIDEILTQKRYGTVTITLTVQPYKRKNVETKYSAECTSGVEKTIYMANNRMEAAPTLIFENAGQLVSWNGAVLERDYAAGSYTPPDLMVVEGANTVVVNTSGTFTVTYREGKL